jgi:SAM-dependent methyltransferase
VAHRHPQPRHPPLLRSLTEDRAPADPGAYFQGPAARWYGAAYGWRDEDIPFYLREAERHAGPGGAVLELAAGEGRVTLPMARAGFHVTAVDSSTEMLAGLRRRLDGEPAEVSRLVEVVEGDIRALQLDRLYRFIYLPFNTLLMLVEPHERYRALEHVREHLAPSGAFALEVFTPDPERLVPQADWAVDIDHEGEDPGGEGPVRVTRWMRREVDYGRQRTRSRFRYRVAGAAEGGAVLAEWEDELEIAYVFPRELELLLERQGFRILGRSGGGDGRPYAPAAGDMQPQYVVARLVP